MPVLDGRQLSKFKCRYIEFYLDNIATAENVSLLYHLAMKIKSVQDIVEDYNVVSS